MNMAININNKQPITATARIIPEPVIRLASADAGAAQDFSLCNMSDLFNYAAPSRSTSVAGLISQTNRWPFTKHVSASLCSLT